MGLHLSTLLTGAEPDPLRGIMRVHNLTLAVLITPLLSCASPSEPEGPMETVHVIGTVPYSGRKFVWLGRDREGYDYPYSWVDLELDGQEFEFTVEVEEEWCPYLVVEGAIVWNPLSRELLEPVPLGRCGEHVIEMVKKE